MLQNPPIFLISGSPGAGKSSVATALMRRFLFGLHIPVDDLREWVVSGIAHPVPRWTDETTRQFNLARQAATQMARLYATAGFAIVIADVLLPADAQKHFLEPLRDFPIYKVLLLPRLEVALARNAQRTNKAFDTSILIETIRNLQESLSSPQFGEAGWTVIDNSDLDVEETVDTILECTSRTSLGHS